MDESTIDDGSAKEVVMIERRWLARVIGVAIVSSVGVYFAFWWGVIMATGNLDPAYVLGIPDALLIAIGSTIIGFIVGLLVARSGGVTGKLMLTVGMIGAGIYLVVIPIGMILIDLRWLGITIMWGAVITGCVLATRWAYLKSHKTPHQVQEKPRVVVKDHLIDRKGGSQ